MRVLKVGRHSVKFNSNYFIPMELNTILNIMAEFGLTADELLLVYTTLCAQDEESHPEYFMKWYIDCNGKTKLKELFESLKTKQVIKKNYNPETYDPNNIEFNQNFIKRFFKHSGAMGEELFNAYESFMFINGKMAPLKTFAKRFNSFEEMYFFYSSQIGHNPKKHQEVMELLKWAQQNKLIHCGIVEFIVSHQWEILKKMKEEGWTPETATTFEVYDLA